ncbi:hypothetical protein VaNZ11_010125 [Volvox africanus]|uniref:Uncharacterized protein n=1 Tax=Volvox africanus TaxID=51714 RepID=A0ABQ5SAI0_9CHLO|nr:hypothetical protein VaNZ11_010125 [Volvox africanus]
MIPQPDQQKLASLEEEISSDILLPEDLIDLLDDAGIEVDDDGLLSDNPTLTSNPRELPDAAAFPNDTLNLTTTAKCDGGSAAAQQHPDALGDLLSRDLDSDTIGFGHHRRLSSPYDQPSAPRECRFPQAYFPLRPPHESAAACSSRSTATLPQQAQQQEQPLDQLRWQQPAAAPSDDHLMAPTLIMLQQQNSQLVPPSSNPAFGDAIDDGPNLSMSFCHPGSGGSGGVRLENTSPIKAPVMQSADAAGTSGVQHVDVLHLFSQPMQQPMQQLQSSPFKLPQPPQPQQPQPPPPPPPQQQPPVGQSWRTAFHHLPAEQPYFGGSGQKLQHGPSTSTSYIWTADVPLPAAQGLQFLPWMPFKAVPRDFNNRSGDIGGGSVVSQPITPPCIDDILECWWRELGGVSDWAAGKVVWMEQQKLGERQHEELAFISDKCCWARSQIQFPGTLVEKLWPNGAGAACTASKGLGGGGGSNQGAHSGLKCQTLQFVGPSELRMFGERQGISSNSGAKQRFARQLKQETATQQQQQERQEQGGGGTTVGLYVIDKYTYTCSGKPNSSPQVEKVMLAQYVGDANQEDLKELNARNVKLKGRLTNSDEWHSGIFGLKGSTPSSYVRLRWKAWWPAVYTVKAPSGRSKAAKATATAGTSAAAASGGPGPSMSGPSRQVTTCVIPIPGSPSTAALCGQGCPASPPESMSQRGLAPQTTRHLASLPPQPCAIVQIAPLQHVHGQHAQHQHRQGFGHGLPQQPSHGPVGQGAASMFLLPHSSVSEQWGQPSPFPESTRRDDQVTTGPTVGLGPTPSSQDMCMGSITAAHYQTALPGPQAVWFPGPVQGCSGLPVQGGLDLAEQALWDRPTYTLPQQVQTLLQPTVHLQQQQQQPFCQALHNNISEVVSMRPPDSQFTGRLDGDGALTAARICTAATEIGYPADASSVGVGAPIVNTATASYVAPLPSQAAAYGHSSEHKPPQEGIRRAAAENAGGMVHGGSGLSEGLRSLCTDLITSDVPSLAPGRSARASCTTTRGLLPGGDGRPVGAGLEAAPFKPLPSNQQNTVHHQRDQQKDPCATLHKAWQGEEQMHTLLESTTGTTTAPRSMKNKRRESNGSNGSGGGGASPSGLAVRRGAASTPRECEVKKHVEAISMFLQVFLKVDMDWTNVLRSVLKSFGTVRNILQLRDCHDQGYGLFNMMLHAAIDIGAEGSPRGVVPGGGSTGDVSSGSDNRSGSPGLEQRLIQAFEVVLERLSEPGTDIPTGEAHKMLLTQQDRECHDTPNHTCARFNLLAVQHWLLERCDAAMLVVPTKDGWLPLATACRCGNVDAAVAYLRRAVELGLFGGQGSHSGPLSPHTQQFATQVLLSDLTPVNKHYRSSNGRRVLEQAIQKVWPHGGAPSVFEGVHVAEDLKLDVEKLYNDLKSVRLG